MKTNTKEKPLLQEPHYAALTQILSQLIITFSPMLVKARDYNYKHKQQLFIFYLICPFLAIFQAVQYVSPLQKKFVCVWNFSYLSCYFASTPNEFSDAKQTHNKSHVIHSYLQDDACYFPFSLHVKQNNKKHDRNDFFLHPLCRKLEYFVAIFDENACLDDSVFTSAAPQFLT